MLPLKTAPALCLVAAVSVGALALANTAKAVYGCVFICTTAPISLNASSPILYQRLIAGLEHYGVEDLWTSIEKAQLLGTGLLYGWKLIVIWLGAPNRPNLLQKRGNTRLFVLIHHVAKLTGQCIDGLKPK